MLEKYMNEEFENLKSEFGGNPVIKKVVLEFEDKRFFDNFF